MIRHYLEKDADIKNKSPEEQKRIIQAYVKSYSYEKQNSDINKIKLWIWMVEVAGVEPASESTAAGASTSVASVLVSYRNLPWAGYPGTISFQIPRLKGRAAFNTGSLLF